GGMSPASRLVSVDLPAPLGPITAWMRSRQRSSVTSCTAARPPKRLVRPRAESSASLMARLLALQRAGQRAQQPARRERHDRDDEHAHRQLPVLAEVEACHRGKVLEGMQQVFEDEGAEDRAGEVAG